MTTNKAIKTKGMLFALVGIIILSPDSLMIRLVEADYYAIIALRGLFVALSISIILLLFPTLRGRFNWRGVILYGILFCIGLATFTLSIKHTYVANTLIILSTAPVIAAILSRIILNEKTAIITWLVCIGIIVGITTIFFDTISIKHVQGNLYALVSAFNLALSSIVVRKNKDSSMIPGLIIGGVLTAVIFAGFAKWDAIDSANLLLLAINGGGVVAISFLLISFAFALLPPVEANLFFLLETVLGSLWVWLMIGEAPTQTTLIASIFILLILIGHGVWLIKAADKS